jgi:hypothetical protein
LRDLDAARLLDAYVRRKQWEAKLLALEVWDLLGKAMNKSKDGKGKTEKVSAGQFMTIAGQKV